jgi:hypothetical protein
MFRQFFVALAAVCFGVAPLFSDELAATAAGGGVSLLLK